MDRGGRGRGRGRPLAMAVMVAVLLQLVVLMPPPVSSQAAVLIPRFSGYVFRAASPLFRKMVRDYLTKQAKQDMADLFRPPGRDQQLGSQAADTAGPFVFNLSIGTTAGQTISGVLDISSQLVWTQCQPCTVCLSPPPTTPAFRPTYSASFSWLPCASQACQAVLQQDCAADVDAHCSYVATYGYATTNTSGYLADETFTFGTTPVPGMVFGCSSESTVYLAGASGIIGFSRGPLSLVSQLRLSRFSYFLAPDDSNGSDSVIRLGDDAVPQTKRGRSTPLLRSSMYPELYYVKLTGIRVDGKDLKGIPAGTFELGADGSGGVVLSTTLPVTYLEETAYGVVREALVSRIKPQAVDGSAVGLDLCYTMRSLADEKVPRVTLVFDGVDAAMELKPANFFFKDNVTGLQCLTMLPMPVGVPVSSILGSLLQTDTNMIYDGIGSGDERLTFETAEAPAAPSQVIIAPLLVVWALILS